MVVKHPVYILISVHIFIHKYINVKYIHAHTTACIHTYIHTYVYTHIHTYCCTFKNVTYIGENIQIINI